MQKLFLIKPFDNMMLSSTDEKRDCYRRIVVADTTPGTGTVFHCNSLLKKYKTRSDMCIFITLNNKFLKCR